MPLSFHDILVPYDGAKTGDRAFNGAIQLAQKFTSKITILACIERESTCQKTPEIVFRSGFKSNLRSLMKLMQ